MRRPTTGSPEFAAADVFGVGKHGFTNGSPGVTAPTVIDAATMNACVGELSNAVEAFGVALNPAAYDQLAQILVLERKRNRARADYAQASNPRNTVSAGYAPTAIASGGTVASPFHVVVGVSGNWQMSVDKGLSWTAAAQAGTATFNACVFDPNASAFVAAGASQTLYKSNNTVTSWSANTPAGGFTGTFYDLIIFNSLIVLSGTSGAGAGEIQTCPVGLTTWTSRTLPAGTTAARQLATDGTTLICAAAATGGDGRVLKSTDGTTWSTAVTITGAGTLKYAAYSAAQGLWFVASDTDIYKSADLTTWTHVSLVLDSGHVYTGIVALEQAVAAFHTHGSLVAQGCQMKFSPDGSNWYAAIGFAGAGFHARPSKVYQCNPGANANVVKHYALWAASPYASSHTFSPWTAPTGLL